MGLTVSIRPAVPGDALAASSLIYSTGPVSFDVAYGSRKRALALISRLFSMTGSICSYQYSTVAEQPGKVSGVLVLHDREMIRKSYARTGTQLLLTLGPLFLMFRLPIYLRQSSMNPEPAPNELFVADVAVSPESRGQGIGKLLMQEAEKIAVAKRYESISLGVSMDNDPAIGLYRNLGYSISSELGDDWLRKRFGIAGVYKMVKQIT